MGNETQKQAAKQVSPKRIDWIDFARGIAMILVIIGHSIGKGYTEQACVGLIFSFHMPLFFILSIVTFKLSATGEQFLTKTEKAFKHLIIPFLFVYLLKTIVELSHMHHNINWANFPWADFLSKNVNTLTYATSISVEVEKAKILPLEFTWFCVALFMGRTIFDYLHLKIKEEKRFIVTVIICAVLGVFIGSKVQILPLNLDIALACMPLFYFGYYLQSHDMEKKINIATAIYFFVWILSLYISYYYFFHTEKHHSYFFLNFADRNYPLFPLFYITAIAGTMFISNCSILLTNKSSQLVQPLLYIGRYSLYLLCLHDMDRLIEPLWKTANYNIYNGISRVILDLIFFVIIMKLIDLAKSHLNKNQVCLE